MKKAVRPDWFEAGDGHVDITLSKPLDVNGTKRPKLRLREPLVSDQLAADEAGGDSDSKRETFLIGNMAELAPSDLNKLTLRDYKRLQYGFLSFID